MATPLSGRLRRYCKTQWLRGQKAFSASRKLHEFVDCIVVVVLRRRQCATEDGLGPAAKARLEPKAKESWVVILYRYHTLGFHGQGVTVVTHKTELEIIDGTPEKRSFLSLISDYNLKIGIFELVDNAIDFWTRGGAASKLNVDILLDPDRQILCARDNAGGVQRKDVRLLISPGATDNLADVDVIGIFGVGGKRTAVALGERVEIKTRYKRESRACRSRSILFSGSAAERL
jgi:hypothetical protein